MSELSFTRRMATVARDDDGGVLPRSVYMQQQAYAAGSEYATQRSTHRNRWPAIRWHHNVAWFGKSA